MGSFLSGRVGPDRRVRPVRPVRPAQPVRPVRQVRPVRPVTPVRSGGQFSTGSPSSRATVIRSRSFGPA
ncbi:hypothetical protein [Streptomyces anulatus]